MQTENYQPIKEIRLTWPYGRCWEMTFLVALVLSIIDFILVVLGFYQFVGFRVIILAQPVYLFFLYNDLNYKTKIYRLDMAELQWDKNNNIGKARSLAINRGLVGSPVSGTLKARLDGENNITRRVLFYRKDCIRSLVIPFSFLLKLI